MAELTRHRHASFTVESTRYVKYNELTVIRPVGVRRAPDDVAFYHLECIARFSENTYRNLIEKSNTPEIARAVLPLCLATELYMTANLREWRHILKLRTDKAAHPRMRQIAGKILEILRDKLPVVVEDINP